MAARSGPSPYSSSWDEIIDKSEASFKGVSHFEDKLTRKLTSLARSRINDWSMNEWISEFADKLSCHYSSEIRETGIALADRILHFPDGSLVAYSLCKEISSLMYSNLFLENATAPIKDPYCLNPSAQLFKKFKLAITITITKSNLVLPASLPEKLCINDFFIEDPRIQLYNIFTKFNNPQLSPVDDTIEMRIALILADYRRKLMLKLVPADIKDRPHQVLYLEKNLQKTFGLIEQREEIAPTHETAVKVILDESKVDKCFRDKRPLHFLSMILKGNKGLDRYRYTRFVDESEDLQRQYRSTFPYSSPIRSGEGYNNPELMVEYVFKIISEKTNRSIPLQQIHERFQYQYGEDAADKIKEYIDAETGNLSKTGVKALLYSTGYLVDASIPKEYDIKM